MRICILSAVMAVILINDSCADETTNQNNLIITYDPGETLTEGQNIKSHHSSYGHITTNGQLALHSRDNGQSRLEDRINDQTIKFEDDNDIEQIQAESGFDVGGHSYQNDRFLKSKRFEAGKIKFEDSKDTLEDFNREANDDIQSHASHVVFEDNKTADDDSKYYDFDTEEKPVDKPIIFENNGDDSHQSSYNENYDRNTVAGRISFTDDSNRIQEPVHKKKRKPRRKPTLQSQENPAPNSPYSGIGNPAYPGAIKPGYPMPGYVNSGHQYPGSAYTAPTYPHSAYIPNSGYGLYPTSGYQGTGESRPPVYPVTYPNSGQGVQSGHPGSRYPSQEYPGSTQTGPSGASYPRPDYPYSQGYPLTGNPQAYPGEPTSQYALQGQTQYRPPGYPGIQQMGYYINGYYGPSRRPKSLPERAVSAVAEALTSIALYDDYQCVPRLLCESAGGSTTLPPTLLKATEGLQPLLTLLQAYNGASSSPLFVFGRAAVTGMAAKGNPAACRQAYPQCPTDPEKLINYLNNHNGGFFRFFGQPAVPQQQQNLEQFYGYLSGQYGFQQQTQQNYGYPSPYKYGLLPQYPGNPYNYGNNYHHHQNIYRNLKNYSEIEERIQNKPIINAFEDDNDQSLVDDLNINSKWLFPEEVGTNEDSERDTFKIKYLSKIPTSGKGLKFPDDRADDRKQINKPRDYLRKEKHVLFPKESYSRLYSNYYYQTTTPVNNEDYVFDRKHNFYVKRPKVVNTDDVVYVVRGNGDPNHPEIVKVRPGQSV